VAAARPLTTEQCLILGALVDPDATVADRTLGMLVRRLSINVRDLAAELEEMAARTPPLARLLADETWERQAWFPTDDGRHVYRTACVSRTADVDEPEPSERAGASRRGAQLRLPCPKNRGRARDHGGIDSGLGRI
jgi:hypothetical protein